MKASFAALVIAAVAYAAPAQVGGSASGSVSVSGSGSAPAAPAVPALPSPPKVPSTGNPVTAGAALPGDIAAAAAAFEAALEKAGNYLESKGASGAADAFAAFNAAEAAYQKAIQDAALSATLLKGLAYGETAAATLGNIISTQGFQEFAFGLKQVQSGFAAAEQGISAGASSGAATFVKGTSDIENAINTAIAQLKSSVANSKRTVNPVTAGAALPGEIAAAAAAFEAALESAGNYLTTKGAAGSAALFAQFNAAEAAYQKAIQDAALSGEATLLRGLAYGESAAATLGNIVSTQGFAEFAFGLKQVQSGFAAAEKGISAGASSGAAVFVKGTQDIENAINTAIAQAKAAASSKRSFNPVTAGAALPGDIAAAAAAFEAALESAGNYLTTKGAAGSAALFAQFNAAEAAYQKAIQDAALSGESTLLRGLSYGESAAATLGNIVSTQGFAEFAFGLKQIQSGFAAAEKGISAGASSGAATFVKGTQDIENAINTAIAQAKAAAASS